MTPVSDALNQSERKQCTIKRLVEKSNGRNNNGSESESDDKAASICDLVSSGMVCRRFAYRHRER